MIVSLEEITTDLDDVGLDFTDVRKVARVAGHDRAVRNEVTEPSLLTGTCEPFIGRVSCRDAGCRVRLLCQAPFWVDSASFQKSTQ